MSNNTFLIAGTGAMACLFAARLSAAGINVSLIGTWKEGLAAIKENGVCLIEPDGLERCCPVQVLPSSSGNGEFHQALVLVKSWQTEQAARLLEPYLDKRGLVVTLQNGMGNREILAGKLGDERVSLGTATLGANLAGPGRVRAGGHGVITLDDCSRLDTMAAILEKAGFQLDRTAGVENLLWGKLVINAAINPLTAILRTPNGRLLDNPGSRVLMGLAAAEAALVARAYGAVLPYLDPVAAAENTARLTAANISSMLQDINRGAPTEIDAISGAVVSSAEKKGLKAPVNQTLLLLVKSIVKEISCRHQE
jgi:2-dehydropantoate 2-reductase